MRLPFLRPKPDAGGADRSAPGSHDPSTLQAARTQARRRLMGAVVLLVVAVAAFPLLFETQPRPVPDQGAGDGRAVVIRAEGVARSVGADAGAPRPESAKPATGAAPAPPPATVEGPAAPEPSVNRTLAGSGTAAAAASQPASKASAAAAPANPPAVANPQVTQVTQADKEKKPDMAVPAPAAASAAGATLADGAARWVVQVGAYNDMERMRQARQKAEKLGFKTYTTEVDTPTGKRTRVRLGPFASRKEAEAAAVKVKAQGMAANVLSL